MCVCVVGAGRARRAAARVRGPTPFLWANLQRAALAVALGEHASPEGRALGEGRVDFLLHFYKMLYTKCIAFFPQNAFYNNGRWAFLQDLEFGVSTARLGPLGRAGRGGARSAPPGSAGRSGAAGARGPAGRDRARRAGPAGTETASAFQGPRPGPLFRGPGPVKLASMRPSGCPPRRRARRVGSGLIAPGRARVPSGGAEGGGGRPGEAALVTVARSVTPRDTDSRARTTP